MTNGQLSYAIFTYNCRQMEWSDTVGIGINANGKFYRNHNMSRSSRANEIACLNYPDSDWSNVLYQLCKLLPFFGTLIKLHNINSTDGNYLPFVELNNANRVILASTLDSRSSNITISTNFSFGSTNVTSLSVSS